jgi:membrane-associated phospholipid phosphatase
LLALCLLGQGGTAQTRQKPIRAKQPAQTRVTLDTVLVMPRATAEHVPPALLPNRDSSLISQAATVIHDSIKAQLKAPIVQVPVTLKSLIVPGALFAYGALTLNNGNLRIFNHESQELFWDKNPHGRPYVEDYLLLVPAVAVYGLNMAGVRGQNNLVDRSIIYGMSNAIANGIGFGIKKLGIEQRPDSSDNFSFPSGHTAEAFVSAEFFHQEYKGRLHWTATATAYGVAVTVAALRMRHNKHWLSDVVAGAGVGIASTRFSYYLYPVIKHWIFGSKKVRQDIAFYPSQSGNGGYGIGLVYQF